MEYFTSRMRFFKTYTIIDMGDILLTEDLQDEYEGGKHIREIIYISNLSMRFRSRYEGCDIAVVSMIDVLQEAVDMRDAI